MAENIQTPVGRFVSGSITEKRTRDHENKAVAEEDQTYQFGVAFDKNDPALAAVFQYMQQVALEKHASHPSVLNFQLQGYSWKVHDGDTPGRDGKVNENTKNSFVFYFSSRYPINVCDNQNAPVEASTAYRGCFVDMVINCNNNGKTGAQAGIYMNPVWVRFQFHGTQIRGGVDAATAFGSSAPVAMPAGASVTPVAGNAPSGAMLGAPSATLPGASPAAGLPTASPSNPATPLPAVPAVNAGATPLPAASPAVQPAHDFVSNAAGLPGIPQT